MAKDNPRKHRIVLSYKRSPVVAVEAWSYGISKTVREVHVAMLDAAGHTIGQALLRLHSRRAPR